MGPLSHKETISVIQTLEDIVLTYKSFRNDYERAGNTEEVEGYNKRIEEYEDAINLLKENN